MVVAKPGTDTRTTAEAEAVMRQAQERARRRRIRITVMVAVLATLVIAAFASHVTEGLATGRPAAPGWTGTVPPGARAGRIVGVIEGCYGNPGRTPFPTLGGIVTLLTGPPPATSMRGVIPRPSGAVVAIERIRTGQRFSFREPSGSYVVSALAGDRADGFFRYPPVAVSLGQGATARIVTAPTVCS